MYGVEGSVGAMVHAYNSDLDKLDNLQNSFVRELNMTPENAFINFNFAPLHLRKDIGSRAFVQGQPRHCTQEIVIAFPAGIAPRISKTLLAPNSASIPNSQFLLSMRDVRLEQMTETLVEASSVSAC